MVDWFHVMFTYKDIFNQRRSNMYYSRSQYDESMWQWIYTPYYSEIIAVQTSQELFIRNLLGQPFEEIDNILYITYTTNTVRTNMPLFAPPQDGWTIVSELGFKDNSGTTILYTADIQDTPWTEYPVPWWYWGDLDENIQKLYDNNYFGLGANILIHTTVKINLTSPINNINIINITTTVDNDCSVHMFTNNLREEKFINLNNRYDSANKISYEFINENIIWPWPNGINPKTGTEDGLPIIESLYFTYTGGDLSGTEILFGRYDDINEYEVYKIMNLDVSINLNTEFIIRSTTGSNNNIWGPPTNWSELNVDDNISIVLDNNNSFIVSESTLDGALSGTYHIIIYFFIRDKTITTLQFIPINETLLPEITDPVIFKSFYLSMNYLNNPEYSPDISNDTRAYWNDLLTTDLSGVDISGVTLIMVNTNNNQINSFTLEYQPNGYIDPINFDSYGGILLSSYYIKKNATENFYDLSIKPEIVQISDQQTVENTTRQVVTVNNDGYINTGTEFKVLYIIFGTNYLPEHGGIIRLEGLQEQSSLILDQKILSFDNINNNYIVDLKYKSDIDVTDSAPGYISQTTKNQYIKFNKPYNATASVIDTVDLMYYINGDLSGTELANHRRRINSCTNIDSSNGVFLLKNMTSQIIDMPKLSHTNDILELAETINEINEVDLNNMRDNIKYELKHYCPPLDGQIYTNQETVDNQITRRYNIEENVEIQLEINELVIQNINDVSVNFLRLDINSTGLNSKWKGIQFKIKLYTIGVVSGEPQSEVINFNTTDTCGNFADLTNMGSGIYKYTADSELNNFFVVANNISPSNIYLIGLLFGGSHSMGAFSSASSSLSLQSSSQVINSDSTAIYIPVTMYPHRISVTRIYIANDDIPCRVYRKFSTPMKFNSGYSTAITGTVIDGLIAGASGELIDIATDTVITTFTTDEIGDFIISSNDIPINYIYSGYLNNFEIRVLSGRDITTNKLLEHKISVIKTNYNLNLEIPNQPIILSPITTITSRLAKKNILLDMTPEKFKEEIDKAEEKVANIFNTTVDNINKNFIYDLNTDILLSTVKLVTIIKSITKSINKVQSDHILTEDKTIDSFISYVDSLSTTNSISFSLTNTENIKAIIAQTISNEEITITDDNKNNISTIISTVNTQIDTTASIINDDFERIVTQTTQLQVQTSDTIDGGNIDFSDPELDVGSIVFTILIGSGDVEIMTIDPRPSDTSFNFYLDTEWVIHRPITNTDPGDNTVGSGRNGWQSSTHMKKPCLCMNYNGRYIALASILDYDEYIYNTSGDPGTSWPPVYHGGVSVYELSNNSWVRRGNTIICGNDFMSYMSTEEQEANLLSINYDGTIIAIGEPYYDNIVGSKYKSNSGKVTIYSYTGLSWELVALFDHYNEYNFAGFCVNLNYDGDILAISCPEAIQFVSDNYGVLISDPDWVQNVGGYVEIYKNTDGIWNKLGQNIEGLDNWVQELSLNIASASDSVKDLFNYAMQSGQKNGYSISLNKKGTHIAIGTPGDVNWARSQYDYRFGIGVSDGPNGVLPTNTWGLNGINAANANRWNPGYVRIFEYNNNLEKWQQLGNTILTTPDILQQAKSTGECVSLNDFGNIVAIIASQEYYNIWNQYNVTTYVYELVDGSWNQKGQALRELDYHTEENSDPICIINGTGDQLVRNYYNSNTGIIGTQVYRYYNNTWNIQNKLVPFYNIAPTVASWGYNGGYYSHLNSRGYRSSKDLTFVIQNWVVGASSVYKQDGFFRDNEGHMIPRDRSMISTDNYWNVDNRGIATYIYEYTDTVYGWSNKTYEISLNEIIFNIHFTSKNNCLISAKRLTGTTDSEFIQITDQFELNKTNKFVQCYSKWPIQVDGVSNEAYIIANNTSVYITQSTIYGKVGTHAENSGFLIHGFEFSEDFTTMRFLDDSDDAPKYPIVFPLSSSSYIGSPHYLQNNDWYPLWWNGTTFNERIFVNISGS